MGFTQDTIHLIGYADLHSYLLLALFGCLAGIYVIVTIIPFDKVGRMNTATASVLMQGGAPATIIGSYFIVGETFSVSQWIGVVVAIIGAAFLSVQLALATNSKPSA